MRPFAAGTLAYLRAVASAGASDRVRAVDAAFDAGDRVAARDAMVAMVLAVVGKPLKSLEYIAKLARSKL